MKRLLITGGSSYLGQHLVPRAIGHYRCLYTTFSHDPLGLPKGVELDIRDADLVSELFLDWRPDVIIHLAGSNRSDDMEEVISRGAEYVTRAAARLGARLIHISTDVIFDGNNAPYREDDPPMPMHLYGKAKAAAEQIVAGHENHVIVRTSLIYGLDIMDLSTKWIIGTLKAGEPITLFTDQIRNPVWAETLSSACLELCESSFQGIINVAGRQPMSRAELGIRLLDWWRFVDRDYLLIGQSGGRWPKDCRLDLSLASKELSTPMLGVDEVEGAAQKR